MLSMLMTTEYAPAEDRHELQQLLIHIAGGEREALAELYQRTRSAVYGLGPGSSTHLTLPAEGVGGGWGAAGSSKQKGG